MSDFDTILEFYNGQKLQLVDAIVKENRAQYQVKCGKSKGKLLTMFGSKFRKLGFECSSFVKWQNLLTEVFLPKGFPSSVTPDYVEYQVSFFGLA